MYNINKIRSYDNNVKVSFDLFTKRLKHDTKQKQQYYSKLLNEHQVPKD